MGVGLEGRTATERFDDAKIYINSIAFSYFPLASGYGAYQWGTATYEFV